MSRKMQRNVILSHGGRHGDAKGTYLKGTAPSVEAAKLMPVGMVAGNDAQPGKPATVKRPDPASVQPSAQPQVRPPRTANALRRFSAGRLERLAVQEDIEVKEGVTKEALQDILVAHFGLK